VNLPQKVVQRGTPHSGEAMWYSNNDQSWADVKISRTLEVPAGADVRFWSWDNYDIEELWDYGFIEVSTDGASTWTQLEVRDEAGNVVSTNDDPNGNLVNFGGL
jgi:immune inhibitor A